MKYATHRRLFIDEAYVEEKKNVRLVMNPAKTLGPVVLQDRLWRSRNTGYYGQVLEVDGQLRLYTWCGWGDEADFPNEPKWKGVMYGRKRLTQLLTSSDGVHWDTPTLGVVEVAGSLRNNIVNLHTLTGTVLYEPDAPAAERFKCLHAVSEVGMKLSVSPDGIHWRMTDIAPFPIMGDSHNVTYFDPRIGKYVLFFRSYAGDAYKNPQALLEVYGSSKHFSPFARAVARVTFDRFEDIASLSMPARHAIYTDCDDPEGLDIYTNGAVRYPLADDVTLLFPSFYQRFPNPDNLPNEHGVFPGNNGILGTQMAVSRDGETFARIRAPYVTGEPVGGIASASNYFFQGMAFRDDRILQYYWAGNYTHGGFDDYADPKGYHRNAVFVCEQRIDGFCSMDFDYAGGALVTTPFALPEGGLHINVDTNAWGNLTVALLPEGEAPIPLVHARLYDGIKGNYLDFPAATRETLAPYVGRPVRLRFAGRAAKLYAYWFV